MPTHVSAVDRATMISKTHTKRHILSVSNKLVRAVVLGALAGWMMISILHVHHLLPTPVDSRLPVSAQIPIIGSNASNPVTNDLHHQLSCKKHGGPGDEFARKEMEYWRAHIPEDARFQSPFRSSKPQYLTFEPDGGGFNNIRMASETIIGIALATGRTLVLFPDQHMYLLSKADGHQKNNFGFRDFFPVDDIAYDQDGLEIITMKQFLDDVAMTGQMRNKDSGLVEFPPNNRTDWNGQDVQPLKAYLRSVAFTPTQWGRDCLAVFPASAEAEGFARFEEMKQQIHKEGLSKEKFLEHPLPVNASVKQRLRESLASRRKLCFYNETMQQEPVLHFMCYHKIHVRMLIHFYAFLFFEDWHTDLWMKRFMRDHIRYIDEIQCSAARIVDAMQSYATELGHTDGKFDTFHVRRGDFQFKRTRIGADEIYNNVKHVMTEQAVVYIATDERDKTYFEPLKKHYNIKFLDDFIKDLLPNLNTNYYGMVDQLVAAKGRNFFGCWHSSFTGYIMRLRGYHSTRHKLPGYKVGLLPTSYYYTPKDDLETMLRYAPLQGALASREFPTSWRDIDSTSVGDFG